MEQIFFLYAGQIDKDTFIYYKLSSLNQTELPSRSLYKKKIFKKDLIGNITPAKLEGDQISYNEKTLPVGRWHDRSAIIKWQIDNTTNKQYIALQNNTNNNEYKKMLEPIRKAYYEASPSKKALIIAEVMKAILS